MRNEIFSQINRNKIQYYSELNNRKIEKTINNENLQNETTNEESEQKKFHFSVFKKFVAARIKQIDGVSLTVRKQITDLSERTRLWISSINNKISYEANVQSNKLTEGLTRISSQLFEDKYEYQEHNLMFKYRRELSYGAVQTLTVPLHLNKNNLTAQFLYWFNKLYCSIIFFLESDEWFESIERSQQISSEQKHQNQLKNSIINSYQKINKSLNTLMKFESEASLFEVKENSSKTAKKGPGKLKERFNFLLLRNQLKTSLNKLFPAINRFI